MPAPGAPPEPYPQGPPNGQPYDTFPSQLVLKAGTFVTVRIDQGLSSDRNKPGDQFAGTLLQPIVIDGIVVAQRGQTVGGRVSEAEKAGRVQGVSRLSIQLTDLTMADGQQVPIQSQLIRTSGPTSVGRDVAAVGGTTALGAAVGAAADWGRGAAIGAAAGAAAGLAGVLLTRGQPTVIVPESVLTFRLQAPATVSLARAPGAFHYVEPGEYSPTPIMQTRPGPPPAQAGCFNCAPPPYGPYAYYAPYPYWGPGFGFYYGPTFFVGRGFWGPGFYSRGFVGRGVVVRGFRR
jgi:hypothetical protein